MKADVLQEYITCFGRYTIWKSYKAQNLQTSNITQALKMCITQALTNMEKNGVPRERKRP